MIFLPLKNLFEDLRFHRDSNSQNESSLESVWVHSLKFSGMQMWLLCCTLNLHLSMFLLWLQAQS
jgi:hypothetical protein